MFSQHIILAFLAVLVCQQNIAFTLPRGHSSYTTLSPLHARVTKGVQQANPANNPSESNIVALIGTDPMNNGFLWKGVETYLKAPGVKTVQGGSPATAAQVQGVAEYIWPGLWKKQTPPAGQIKSQGDLEITSEVT